MTLVTSVLFLLEISTEVDNDIVVDSKVGDIGLLVDDIKVDNVTVVVVVPNINFSHRNCEDYFLNLMTLTTIALWSTRALLRPSRLSS